MSIKGRSLELFFVDGKPDGMQTAEVFNWTGHVLLTPRTRLADALRRREARHSGVYLLLGEDDKTGEPLLYVGESENVGERIRTHDTHRDWWTTAVLVTTAGNALHKAHIKYLEARLLEIAGAVGTVALANNILPARASLSEAAAVNMEVFLDTLRMVLPALRIDCFLARTRPAGDAGTAAGTAAPVFELVSKKHDLRATALFVDGEMVVQAGSQARDGWHSSSTGNSGYATLHRDLVRTGVLRPADGHTVFTQNYGFKSTSAAAAVVTGRPTAGPTAWKRRGSGQTYKAWEQGLLAADADPAATDPAATDPAATDPERSARDE